MGNLTMGIPRTESHAILFFVLSGSFVIMEDIVFRLSKRVIFLRGLEQGIWGRRLGYLWVMFWMNVIAPLYVYPIMRLPADCTSVIPYSIVRHLWKLAMFKKGTVAL